jgi:NAD(P)-dependent dehydrogenase (short-subunit alcohol dehydrogenase family)
MSGRRALVTGASRGLGAALCRVLRARGYYVIGVSSTRSSLAADGVDEGVQLDLADHNAVTRLAEFGPVDVLINNAAIYLDDPRLGAGDLLGLDMESLHRTVSVNLIAAVSICQQFLPGMLDRGFGRIANVSSGMARLDQFDEFSFAYRVSKLGLNALTLSLARMSGRPLCDVSVFAYCPGWIRTHMGGAAAPGTAEDAAAGLAAWIERAAPDTNGRFLRSDRALDWSTKVER